MKREDVFVTTKHWITMRGYQKTVEALETSLRDLGLDYLDSVSDSLAECCIP